MHYISDKLRVTPAAILVPLYEEICAIEAPDA